MEIIEIAKKLGELLRESDEFKKYQEARDNCRADSELEGKINEFKIQKKVYDTEFAREGHDEDMLAAIKARLDTLYEEINEKEIMKQFNIAEDNFNILLNAVNMTISSYITEQPYAAEGACSHDCSKCSGCH